MNMQKDSIKTSVQPEKQDALMLNDDGDLKQRLIERFQYKNTALIKSIYAENKLKASSTHNSLKCLHFNHTDLKLPLYSQPSDLALYHDNIKSFKAFRPRLLKFLQRKKIAENKLAERMKAGREQMTSKWLKHVEKLENNPKRRQKVQRARQLYEKEFPEIKKLREQQERFDRLGSRGVAGGYIRSEAEVEEIADNLKELDASKKHMKLLSIQSPMLLGRYERCFGFINNNGLICNLDEFEKERKAGVIWGDKEKQIFRDKFAQHPKDFEKIASFIEQKNCADCVLFYYMNKKKECFKSSKSKPKKKGKINKSNVHMPLRMEQSKQKQMKNEDEEEDEQQEVEVQESSSMPPKVELKKTTVESSTKASVTTVQSEQEVTEPVVDAVSEPAKSTKSLVKVFNTRSGKMIQKTVPVKVTEPSAEVCETDHPPLKMTIVVTSPSHVDVNSTAVSVASIVSETVTAAGLLVPPLESEDLENQEGKVEELVMQHLSKMQEHSDPSRWSESEMLKAVEGLKKFGRSWQSISKIVESKSEGQCKNFYFNYKKKFNLESILGIYKRGDVSITEDDAAEDDGKVQQTKQDKSEAKKTDNRGKPGRKTNTSSKSSDNDAFEPLDQPTMKVENLKTFTADEKKVTEPAKSTAEEFRATAIKNDRRVEDETNRSMPPLPGLLRAPPPLTPVTSVVPAREPVIFTKGIDLACEVINFKRSLEVQDLRSYGDKAQMAKETPIRTEDSLGKGRADAASRHTSEFFDRRSLMLGDMFSRAVDHPSMNDSRRMLSPDITKYIQAREGYLPSNSAFSYPSYMLPSAGSVEQKVAMQAFNTRFQGYMTSHPQISQPDMPSPRYHFQLSPSTNKLSSHVQHFPTARVLSPTLVRQHSPVIAQNNFFTQFEQRHDIFHQANEGEPEKDLLLQKEIEAEREAALKFKQQENERRMKYYQMKDFEMREEERIRVVDRKKEEELNRRIFAEKFHEQNHMSNEMVMNLVQRHFQHDSHQEMSKDDYLRKLPYKPRSRNEKVARAASIPDLHTRPGESYLGLLPHNYRSDQTLQEEMTGIRRTSTPPIYNPLSSKSKEAAMQEKAFENSLSRSASLEKLSKHNNVYGITTGLAKGPPAMMSITGIYSKDILPPMFKGSPPLRAQTPPQNVVRTNSPPFVPREFESIKRKPTTIVRPWEISSECSTETSRRICRSKVEKLQENIQPVCPVINFAPSKDTLKQRNIGECSSLPNPNTLYAVSPKNDATAKATEQPLFTCSRDVNIADEQNVSRSARPVIQLSATSTKFKEQIITFAQLNSPTPEIFPKFDFNTVSTSKSDKKIRLRSESSLSPTFPMPNQSRSRLEENQNKKVDSKSRPHSDSEDTISSDEVEKQTCEARIPADQQKPSFSSLKTVRIPESKNYTESQFVETVQRPTVHDDENVEVAEKRTLQKCDDEVVESGVEKIDTSTPVQDENETHSDAHTPLLDEPSYTFDEQNKSTFESISPPNSPQRPLTTNTSAATSVVFPFSALAFNVSSNFQTDVTTARLPQIRNYNSQRGFLSVSPEYEYRNKSFKRSSDGKEEDRVKRPRN